MSLRWRILLAFAIVILFTVALSMGVEYLRYGDRLSSYRAKTKSDDLAGTISRAYTTDGSWDSLPDILQRSGYIAEKKHLQDPSNEGEALVWMPVGAVVQDIDGRVLIDTLSAYAQGEDVAVIEGDPSPIYDLESREVVGTLTINLNRAWVRADARKAVADALYPTAIGGALTAIVALLLAFWMTRRITAPVLALTQATQAMADGRDSQLLPVTSPDELGQMSASFNSMMTALETQRALRQRLVNDVSHELNTPLSVIRLEASGLRDGMQPAEIAAEHIIDQVEMLGSLVQDLTWLAETDSGALRLETVPTSVGPWLEREVERWQVVAQASEVLLELAPLSDEPVVVSMDAIRMGQALGNLIQNALQHTAAGGQVSIRCSAMDDAVEIAVADSGAGISADDLPHLFERFYRSDASRQRASGGRGLGLAIAQQIMLAHGGEIGVESVLGQGSHFALTLPRQDA